MFSGEGGDALNAPPPRSCLSLVSALLRMLGTMLGVHVLAALLAAIGLMLGRLIHLHVVLHGLGSRRRGLSGQCGRHHQCHHDFSPEFE
jgi:hypothetical protein